MADYLRERQLVLQTCLQLVDLGFLPATGGNVALRVSAHDFVVTPSAADYSSMCPADLCVLNLATLARINGENKPSVESGLHACLLRFRADFTASIHTHEPLASAVSLLNLPIPIRVDQRHELGEIVPIIPYAPSGTRLLVRALRRRLRPDLAAYLLRNHGLVCGGATLELAFENCRLVERAAACFLRDCIAPRESIAPDADAWRQAMALLNDRTTAGNQKP